MMNGYYYPDESSQQNSYYYVPQSQFQSDSVIENAVAAPTSTNSFINHNAYYSQYYQQQQSNINYGINYNNLPVAHDNSAIYQQQQFVSSHQGPPPTVCNELESSNLKSNQKSQYPPSTILQNISSQQYPQSGYPQYNLSNGSTNITENFKNVSITNTYSNDPQAQYPSTPDGNYSVNNNEVSAATYKSPSSQSYPASFMPPTINSSKLPQISDTNKLSAMSNSSQECSIDLLQRRNLFSDDIVVSTIPTTHYSMNCDPNIMQCTLNTIPTESNLLSKCRLPLGIHIQPFRETETVLVNTNVIVRCRSCRTYINPFVALADHQRRWHCNVCTRVNDLPDEFMFDPVSKTYGNPSKRPELQQCSIEYTANPDYTVRPPMAAVYVFCFDVSQAAVSTGYLSRACNLILENLEKIPGDSRRQMAFFTYNSFLQFYQIQENSFKLIMWPDVEQVDLPCFEDLLVDVHDRREIIRELLDKIPETFSQTLDNGNCLGFALQVATKLISHNGGRLTIINGSLPNVGPGSLKLRDSKDGDARVLQPASDYYKTLALQCANDQISVDLFGVGSKYSDLATISVISRHSSGCCLYYGNLRITEDAVNVNANDELIRLTPEQQLDSDRFTRDFRRYLTRPIGFEAVMRTRCSRGLELTAFHGNLFMRSTNVIALPVVNPDASYAIQFKIVNSLSEWNYLIIQSALLYTTSTSERRIRVHTMCLPVSERLDQIFANCNSPAITGLIAKIAVDKCTTDGFSNVREAFVNSLVDPLKVYNSNLNNQSRGSNKPLLCTPNMSRMAPFVLGLLRNQVFRASTMHIDDRFSILENLRCMPLTTVLHRLYPYMVSVHQLSENIPLKLVADKITTESIKFNQPPRLNMTSASISRDGAFLMDTGDCCFLFLGEAVSNQFLKQCFGGIEELSKFPRDKLTTQFEFDSVVSQRLKLLTNQIIENRSIGTSIITILPDSPLRSRMLHHFVEDRMENSMSYFEFLRSVQTSVYS